MTKETQEIINEKLPNPVGTKEENHCMVDILSLLAPESLQKKSWMCWWKNLLNLGKKNQKGILCGLELEETEVQFFLERLRVLLALVGRPYLHLAVDRSGENLTVGLAVGGAKSTRGEIAVDLFGWSLWKVLSSFQRYYTVDIGSQVFSSSG